MKTFITLILCIIFGYTTLFAQNQNISNGVVFDGEPFLAINPYNTQHMVVAWMGWKLFEQIVIKTRVSYDAGKSWSEAVPLLHVSPSFSSADPSLAFDHEGNVFVSYIDYNKLADSGGVFIRKSLDGGLSWNDPVKVIDMHSDVGKKPIDRPWMVIDRSDGPNQGTIYISTMNAKGAVAPFNPYLNYSSDGGETWEPWQYIDATGWLAGSLIPQPMPTPAISANGVFRCIYPSYVFVQNTLPQFIHASFDNETSGFEYHTVYESAENVSDTLSKKGYLIRANPVDEAHLVFFFLSMENGDIDVYFAESLNNGIEWTVPLRVNDDEVGNGIMQDLLWADFDEDGDLVVTWRDRRNAIDTGYTVPSEIWGSVRWKDSLDFSINFRISDTIVAYDSVLALSGNDFMCVAFHDDTLNAVWGDTRNGTLNIWLQRMAVADSLVSDIFLIDSSSLPSVSYFPNPATSSITLKGSELSKIELYDLNGRKVLEKRLSKSIEEISLEEIADGTYIINIESSFGHFSGKLIKK